MRSKIAVVGSMVLAGAIAGDNRASACGIADTDTDLADLQIFLCQGNPNPLPDPLTGQMDPNPSIFFASNGRGSIAPPPECNSTLMTPLTFLPAVPAADCSAIPCPDPNAIQQTGNSQWSFFIQDNDRFHLDNNEWSGNGKSDTLFYNVNQPYSKMLNIAYLTWFGLKDDDTKLFHGTKDYVNLMRAFDSDQWHSSFFRNVHQGASDFNGDWSQSFIGDDEVWMGCRMFDNSAGGAENNVALRMVTQIHEMWHAWENWWVEGGGIGHLNAPSLAECQSPGACDCTVEDSCDRFNPHRLDAYRPFGNLWTGVADATGCFLPPRDCLAVIGNRHTPNQIAWEYMCDLMTSPADWVTDDVQTKAGAAQDYLNVYFIHDPAIQCMSNHPMMGGSI